MNRTLYFSSAAQMFEVNRNRELRTMAWVAFGNDLLIYVELVDRPDGAAIFGCFVMLVLIASRAKVRWHLVDHRPLTNARSDCSPGTVAGRTRAPDDRNLTRNWDAGCDNVAS